MELKYLIPSWENSLHQRELFRKSCLQSLIDRACQICHYPPQQISVRKIMSNDMGISSWRTPPQLAHTSSVWFEKEVEINRFYCFYKIAQLSTEPKVSTLSFRMKNHPLFAVELTELYMLIPILKVIKDWKVSDYIEREFKQIFGDISNLVAEGYFPNPFIFSHDDQICVDITSDVENPDGDKLMLVGFVAEPSGVVI